MTVAEWLPYLIAAAAAIPGIASLFLQRRKDTADVAETYQDIGLKWAARIESLEADLRKERMERMAERERWEAERKIERQLWNEERIGMLKRIDDLETELRRKKRIGDW